jgi:hypothetical protein
VSALLRGSIFHLMGSQDFDTALLARASGYRQLQIKTGGSKAAGGEAAGGGGGDREGLQGDVDMYSARDGRDTQSVLGLCGFASGFPLVEPGV